MWTSIPVQVLEQVDRLCLDFERSFRAGDGPRLESYLRTCLRRVLSCRPLLPHPTGAGFAVRAGERAIVARSTRNGFPTERQVVELAWGEPTHFEVVLEVIIGPHRGRRFTFRRHDSFIVGRGGLRPLPPAAEGPLSSRASIS